jgi:hypothetical protein
MTWWTTQLIFRDDTLISEGIDPVPLNEYEWVVNGKEPIHESEHYTRVIVSGYALYGTLHGYYALGIAHWWLDRSNGRVYMSESSQYHTESITSLTTTQRAIVRECLIHLNPSAWENSHATFRQKLEGN